MKKYILLLVLVYLLVALAAQAVERPPQLGSYGPPQPGEAQAVEKYISYIYWVALVAGGVLAFALIVWGGILYITSAGNPAQQTNARTWIGSAILGLLLLLGAYIILNTINPELVALKFPALQSIRVQGPQLGEGISVIGGGATGGAAGGTAGGTVSDCQARGGRVMTYGEGFVCLEKDAASRQKITIGDGPRCTAAEGQVVILGDGPYCTKPFK